MKRLNQKGFSHFEIALLILVVALIGFAGYTVWQKNKPESAATTTVVTEKKDTKTESTNSQSDPTSDWKTYTSTTGKFTLKHPKTWATASNPELCAEGLVMFGADSNSVGRCAADGARAFGQMAITWRSDRKDLSSCGLNLNEELWTIDSTETTTVAGVQAVKTSGTYKNDDQAQGGQAKGNKAVQYCFVGNGSQYIASYTKWSDYPDVLSDFNTMVTKTFKFK